MNVLRDLNDKRILSPRGVVVVAQLSWAMGGKLHSAAHFSGGAAEVQRIKDRLECLETREKLALICLIRGLNQAECALPLKISESEVNTIIKRAAKKLEHAETLENEH